MNIAVIGAGASGIMAALAAADGRNSVTLFDHNPSPGRKLLVTGSGRCNLSNRQVHADAYTCANLVWMEQLLSNFSVDALLERFSALEIPIFASPDDWCYPLSESAQSVVEILAAALVDSGVSLRLSTHISAFGVKNGRFWLQIGPAGQAKVETFDALIVAAGGKAYPTLGSRGELFDSLAQLGHTVKPLVPALGPIYADLGAYRGLQGLRFDAHTGIWQAGTRIGSGSGNLIITKQGFNGPGVMNLSHWVGLAAGQDLSLHINFLGDKLLHIEHRLVQREASKLSVANFVAGFCAPKAAAVFTAAAGLAPDLPLRSLSSAQAQALTDALSCAIFKVSGAGSFKDSQVSAGGVPVVEVDPHTCQSSLIPGLYLSGETLDVVGPCGGYNLHFAFSSGILAGSHLASLSKT